MIEDGCKTSRGGAAWRRMLWLAALSVPLLTSCARPEHEPVENGERSSSGAPTGPFSDVTESSGVRFSHEAGARGDFWLPEGIGSGGALFDMDDDGDLDLYLVQGDDLREPDEQYRNRLLRNDGRGRFDDVSEGSGADLPGYGLGCAAADYDADGDVDLYVTRLGPNALLRNDGAGRFSDVTAASGVGDPGFGCGATFLDYDRDGVVDLYVTNYVDWTPHREGSCFDRGGIRDYCGPVDYAAPSADRLYRGRGGGAFEDVSERAGIASALGNGLGVVSADFNGDGWVDVYVANDQTPAFLWINQRDGTFVEDAALSGCGFNADGIAIAGMGVAAEDLDGDEHLDLVVTNIHDQAHLGLRNEGGFFTDVSHEWGLAGWGVPYTGFGIALFDQDHDGALEGFIVNGAVNRLPEPYRSGHDYAEPNQFLRRDEAGKFYDASEELGQALLPHEMSRGLLVGDLDNDGDLDLVITNNRGPTRVLRNENRSENAWIGLDLRGPGGGRHALNARVEIHANERVWRREVRPHASYLASNDPRIHAGLGPVGRVERLVVTWPDGSREEHRDVPVNRYLRLEPGGVPQTVAEPSRGQVGET